ncbi:hypothetical protein EDB81DRAFT_764574 [Dactylonectria macrodidyma]|uniref:Uncharacterized protein n=1 Tax=Dactylonectria macrodidyma TaxID=307937 RepID=A0A9P9DYM6_9HYPO|nr:hypothetical protein EDB81DRAFT_764574 [Dactylonectria macrodidyma]
MVIPIHTTKQPTYVNPCCFACGFLSYLYAPSWSWTSVRGRIAPFTKVVLEQLVVVLSVGIKSAHNDQFGRLVGGSLSLSGVLFKFPSLTQIMGDWGSFSENSKFDDWALSLDHCGQDYCENETWFLPLAKAPPASTRRGLDICEILIRRAITTLAIPVFTRVGITPDVKGLDTTQRTESLMKLKTYDHWAESRTETICQTLENWHVTGRDDLCKFLNIARLLGLDFHSEQDSTDSSILLGAHEHTRGDALGGLPDRQKCETSDHSKLLSRSSWEGFTVAGTHNPAGKTW